MKKRVLALALAAAMMVGVLTSCGSSGSGGGSASGGNSSDGALNNHLGCRYPGRNHSATEYGLCFGHSG